MSSVSVESHVEQGGMGCVSVFWAAGFILVFWPQGTVDKLVARSFRCCRPSRFFWIGMIIALCHNSGICPFEIDRLKMLVRYLIAPLVSFLRLSVLIPSGPMVVDDLANRIASFVSAGMKDAFLLMAANGIAA